MCTCACFPTAPFTSTYISICIRAQVLYMFAAAFVAMFSFHTCAFAFVSMSFIRVGVHVRAHVCVSVRFRLRVDVCVRIHYLCTSFLHMCAFAFVSMSFTRVGVHVRAHVCVSVRVRLGLHVDVCVRVPHLCTSVEFRSGAHSRPPGLLSFSLFFRRLDGPLRLSFLLKGTFLLCEDSPGISTELRYFPQDSFIKRCDYKSPPTRSHPHLALAPTPTSLSHPTLDLAPTLGRVVVSVCIRVDKES